MTQEEIAAVLADHARWLRGEGGNRASLVGASLARASLVGAILVGASLDGARLDGASLARASLDGANLARASLVGARLDGASLDGARLVGANLDGASLDGANLDGANLARASLVGAILDGAKIKGATVKRLLRRAMRSDGYEFFLWHCQEGFFIAAGCRWFTMAEARQHWTATRAGTPLGDESLDILYFFDVAITRTEKEI